jgi:UDP-N-acetylmuramoyl-tripeptide--D-alanyl-D-alanine ligase
VQRFGIVADADGSRFVLATPAGDVAVSIAMPGRHNVRNALAAASLALGLGASLDAISDGLAAARSVAGRLVQHALRNGATLVDDSYNANPGSLNAAIELLAGAARPGWLVLGDMRELGDDARALHAEAGRRAKAAGIARLYALGPLSAATVEAFGEGARHFEDHDALAIALAEALASAVAGAAPVVLVKGSRGSAMDKIVKALLEGEAADAA